MDVFFLRLEGIISSVASLRDVFSEHGKILYRPLVVVLQNRFQIPPARTVDDSRERMQVFDIGDDLHSPFVGNAPRS